MLMLFLTVAMVHIVALMSPGPDFFFVSQTAVSRSRKEAMMGVLGAAIIVGCTVAATLLDSSAEKDQVEELPAFDPAFEVAQTRTSMNHSL